MSHTQIKLEERLDHAIIEKNENLDAIQTTENCEKNINNDLVNDTIDMGAPTCNVEINLPPTEQSNLNEAIPEITDDSIAKTSQNDSEDDPLENSLEEQILHPNEIKKEPFIDDDVTEAESDVIMLPESILGDPYRDPESIDWTSDSEFSSSSSSPDYSSDDDSLFICKSPKNQSSKNPPQEIKKDLEKCFLPEIKDLQISVTEEEAKEIGEISEIIDNQVIVQAMRGIPAINLESILFLNKGKRALGEIFEVFGKVDEPLYIVRFNSPEHITKKEIVKGQSVYYAPTTDHTHFVIMDELMSVRGSDASWKKDMEVPEKFLDYSDDEEERNAKIAYRQQRNMMNETTSEFEPPKKRQNPSNPFSKQDHPLKNRKTYANPFNQRCDFSSHSNAWRPRHQPEFGMPPQFRNSPISTPRNHARTYPCSPVSCITSSPSFPCMPPPAFFNPTIQPPPPLPHGSVSQAGRLVDLTTPPPISFLNNNASPMPINSFSRPTIPSGDNSPFSNNCNRKSLNVHVPPPPPCSPNLPRNFNRPPPPPTPPHSSIVWPLSPSNRMTNHTPTFNLPLGDNSHLPPTNYPPPPLPQPPFPHARHQTESLLSSGVVQNTFALSTPQAMQVHSFPNPLQPALNVPPPHASRLQVSNLPRFNSNPSLPNLLTPPPLANATLTQPPLQAQPFLIPPPPPPSPIIPDNAPNPLPNQLYININKSFGF